MFLIYFLFVFPCPQNVELLRSFKTQADQFLNKYLNYRIEPPMNNGHNLVLLEVPSLSLLNLYSLTKVKVFSFIFSYIGYVVARKRESVCSNSTEGIKKESLFFPFSLFVFSLLLLSPSIGYESKSNIEFLKLFISTLFKVFQFFFFFTFLYCL